MDREKEYALVLAGGGTKGAYQVGVWQALKELNINVKAIAGASIGALNGALILQNDFEKMLELYGSVAIKDVINITGEISNSDNLFDIKNIKKILANFIANKGFENEPLKELINKYIDIDKIYKSDIDFGLITYSSQNKVPLQLFKNEIPKSEMVDFLLASSCFPIYKAQKVGQMELVDGGMYDNIPINMLIKKGYKNIIVADIKGPGASRKIVDKHVYLKIISPKGNIGGTFEFNKQKIKNNIILGYLDTMKAFNEMQGHIYYFRSEEFNKMLEVFNLQTIYGLEAAAKIYDINLYHAYNMEEFLELLYKKHKETKEKYETIKDDLIKKQIKNWKKNLESIFEDEYSICFATDLYLERPFSKKIRYAKKFLKSYIESVEALIELEDYMK